MRMGTFCLAVFVAALMWLAVGANSYAQSNSVYVLFEEWNFAGVNNWDNFDGTGRRYGEVKKLAMDVFSSGNDHSVDGEVRGNPHTTLDMPQNLPRWMTIAGKQGWGVVITYRLTNPTTEPGNLDASFTLFDMAQNGTPAPLPNTFRFFTIDGHWVDGGNNLDVHVRATRNNPSYRLPEYFHKRLEPVQQ